MNVENCCLDKVHRPFNIVFYILFSVFYNYHFMMTTMFYSDVLYEYSSVFVKIYDTCYVCLVMLSIISILLLYNGVKNRFFPLVVFLIAFVYNQMRCITEVPVIAVFFLLIICSPKKSFRVIGTLILTFGWSWIVASAIACRMGVISDIVFYGTRHSFGSIYMTDLACHFLALMMVLCIIRQGKLKIYDYLMGFFLLAINLVYMKAKIGALCLLFLLLGTYFYQYIIGRCSISPGCITVFKNACTYGILVLIPIAFYFTIYYSEDPSMFYNKFSVFNTLKSRFMLGKQALSQYPISIWGTAIQERANGGSKTGIVENYFFIDISFLRILLFNGVVVWLMTIALFIKIQVSLNMKKAYYLMFVVFIFIIDCSIEHHMIELAYSFAPFLLFAGIGTVAPKGDVRCLSGSNLIK